MNLRQWSAAALVVVLAATAGCRHRPKLSDDYEARDLPPWKRIFGKSASSDSNANGGSGWKGAGTGSTGAPPKVTVGGGNLDNEDLFASKSLSSSMLDGSGGVEKRWETVVYFAYNKSFVGEAERPKLDQLADYLSRNPTLQLIIEGHCDERGSEEFNRALGERRAIALRSYLETLGVAESRLKTISYGEERLRATGASEADHAQNRRGEFVVITPTQ